MKTKSELSIFKKTSIKALKALYLLSKTYLMESTIEKLNSGYYETHVTITNK